MRLCVFSALHFTFVKKNCCLYVNFLLFICLYEGIHWLGWIPYLRTTKKTNRLLEWATSPNWISCFHSLGYCVHLAFLTPMNGFIILVFRLASMKNYLYLVRTSFVIFLLRDIRWYWFFSWRSYLKVHISIRFIFS